MNCELSFADGIVQISRPAVGLLSDRFVSPTKWSLTSIADVGEPHRTTRCSVLIKLRR